MKLVICNSCGLEKEQVAKGLCKKCYMKWWEGINKIRRKEYHKNYSKQYRAEHRITSICCSKEYRKNNKDKIRKLKKENYEKNKDKGTYKEKGKIYREKNKDKINKRVKQYYKKNKGERLKYNKKWYEKNRIKQLEKLKEKRKKENDEENKRRTKLRLPLIGDGLYKSEDELCLHICTLFQESSYKIIRHYRAFSDLKEWGKWGLELDIYISGLKLAFEYQGKQHYLLSSLYNQTKEEFEYQQYKDRCKKKLCKLKGITLIKIRYDEDLSEQLILSKLKYVNIDTNQQIL